MLTKNYKEAASISYQTWICGSQALPFLNRKFHGSIQYTSVLITFRGDISHTSIATVYIT